MQGAWDPDDASCGPTEPAGSSGTSGADDAAAAAPAPADDAPPAGPDVHEMTKDTVRALIQKPLRPGQGP